MTNIPAVTSAIPAPCAAPRSPKPQPLPASSGKSGAPAAPAETALKTPAERADAAKTDAGTADPGSAACLAMPGPQWRTPPKPGEQPLTLAPSGDPLPYGGKGSPVFRPTLPVELPATDAQAPGASPPADPSSVTANLPAESALHAALLKLVGGPGKTLPAAPGEAPSLPGFEPPVAAPETGREVSRERTPQEFVAPLRRAGDMPSLPVMPVVAPQESGKGPRHNAADGALPKPSSELIAAVAARAAGNASAGHATGVAAERAAVMLENALQRNSASASSPAGTSVTVDAAGAADLAARPAAATDAGAATATAAPAPATAAQSVQASAPAVATTQLHLPESVGSDEWNEAVAQRLSQLAESPHSRASIRLNPPQLGPMQIEVHVDGDRAVVSLAVHHDATRDALEQAMPRLRAQLEDNGFASIDVNVSHNPHRQHPGRGEPYLESSSYLAEDVLAPAPARSVAAAGSRLLDAYA